MPSTLLKRIRILLSIFIAGLVVSGVGLRRFAEQHGLGYSQLHYWIYGGQARAGRRKVVEPGGSGPVFRELMVPARSEREWTAEISLPEGTRLRLGRGADPVWVGALLDQLRRPCLP